MNVVKLWDWPVRLCHWLLVIGLAASWWTAEYDHMNWHQRAGYLLLGTLLFRFYWGFVGSHNARFSQFFSRPSTVWAYLKTFNQRKSTFFLGHNPVGALSALLLILVVALQVGLGLFAEDVDGLASGPLSFKISYENGRWAAETHEDFFDIVLALIAIHVAAIFFYLFYKRDNLITPMISGRKTVAEEVTALPTISALWLRAVIGITLATGLTWWIVNL